MLLTNTFQKLNPRMDGNNYISTIVLLAQIVKRSCIFSWRGIGRNAHFGGDEVKTGRTVLMAGAEPAVVRRQ